MRDGLPGLRNKALLADLRHRFAGACQRPGFRLVHYSVQRDHLHLIVEASDQKALGRGMISINARIARAVQRSFQLKGRILSGAYHIHLLSSLSEVRRALAYVLLNIRKHSLQRHGHAPPLQLDRASSSRWFEGFTRKLALAPGARPAQEPREVAPPRTWALREGWKKAGGLIDPSAIPGN